MASACKVVDKIDTEDLILEIEKYPSIWNPQTDEYCDRVAKKIAWTNVLNRFIQDFQEKELLEKNEYCNLLQKKWKNLRDCYSREVNKQKHESKLGPAAKPRKTYMFYDNLKFLEAATKHNTNCEIDEDGFKYSEESGNEESIHFEEAPLKPKVAKKRKAVPVNEDEKPPKCPKSKAQTSQQQLIGKDEDRLFLLSLVSELKKVPEHIKLELKSRILLMISQAKLAARAGNQRGSESFQHDGFNFGQFTPVQITVPVNLSPMFSAQSAQAHSSNYQMHSQAASPSRSDPLASPEFDY